MIIFVFGNEDLKEDRLPLRILPHLRVKFPSIEFVVKDPNEEWEIPLPELSKLSEAENNSQNSEIVIIDTAVGIKEVTIFESLEKFARPPRVGMHDFDALTNLRFLVKLGKIKKVKIIAIPPDISESEAFKKISNILSSF
jgi:hypothetical protein